MEMAKTGKQNKTVNLKLLKIPISNAEVGKVKSLGMLFYS